jgi:hypothetical protein
MEREFTQEQKYVLAKKIVEKISKFYKHLATYIVVNIFLTSIFIVSDMNDGDTFNAAFWDYHNYKIWLFWGIGIFFQALNTFGIRLIFNKDWEERKVSEYMDQQDNRS